MYYHQTEIPPDHQVLHTCGNKFCLTKEHLYLAPNPTKKERPPPKKVGARSDLTPDDIIDIRQRHNIDDETLASIALRYNKTVPTIWNIVKGITHKHVPFNPEHKPQEIL